MLEVASPKDTVLRIAAILTVGLVLRAPITSLASILPTVQEELEISPTVAGLISSLPIFCFGLGAFVVIPASRRLGINRLLQASLWFCAGAVALRPFGGYLWIVAMTIAIGLAITIGNVLLPVVIRRDFGTRQGIAVATSTAAITGSGMVGAALTVPVAFLLGWRWALAGWALLAVLAALSTRMFGPEAPVISEHRPRPVWAVPAAWALAGFFGLFSSLFYVMTVWLPTILAQVAEVSAVHAGMIASVFQGLGIIGALITPPLMARMTHNWIFAMACSLMWVICLVGLIIAPEYYMLWTILGGAGQGGVFAMFWLLIAQRGRDIDVVRDLSGMAQAVGYTISTCAPIAVGMALEATGSWKVVLLIPLACAVLLTTLAPVVASRKVIGI